MIVEFRVALPCSASQQALMSLVAVREMERPEFLAEIDQFTDIWYMRSLFHSDISSILIQPLLAVCDMSSWSLRRIASSEQTGVGLCSRRITTPSSVNSSKQPGGSKAADQKVESFWSCFLRRQWYDIITSSMQWTSSHEVWGSQDLIQCGQSWLYCIARWKCRYLSLV